MDRDKVESELRAELATLKLETANHNNQISALTSTVETLVAQAPAPKRKKTAAKSTAEHRSANVNVSQCCQQIDRMKGD